jgi:hypothetical protein
MKSALRIVSSKIPGRTQKAVQDTVAGCHGLAAADIARASLMDTENGRRRLESSALSWANRAELIQRLDDSFEERRAVARSEWEEGEPAPGRRQDPRAGAAS